MYGWGRDDGEGLGGARPMSTAALMSSAPTPPPQGQWGQEETRELIRIRAEAERGSASPARSNALWDAVSAEMLRRGFARTPDQCKCKWKNLLNRYKGKETTDSSDGRECPFFDELHTLFTERARKMQRLLLETEMGSQRSRKKVKRSNALGPSSDEFSENEEEEKDDSVEEAPAKSKAGSNARKRKAERAAPSKSSSKALTVAPNSGADIREVLEEFFQQQIRVEKQWAEMMERRAREHALFEQEWRQYTEKLERERLMTERAWREREEQRRARDESRAERRDALLTTLLKSLINDQ